MTDDYKNFLENQVTQGLKDIEQDNIVSLEESRQLCQKAIYDTLEELRSEAKYA